MRGDDIAQGQHRPVAVSGKGARDPYQRAGMAQAGAKLPGEEDRLHGMSGRPGLDRRAQVS
jgi:hypothetical protein